LIFVSRRLQLPVYVGRIATRRSRWFDFGVELWHGVEAAGTGSVRVRVLSVEE